MYPGQQQYATPQAYPAPQQYARPPHYAGQAPYPGQTPNAPSEFAAPYTAPARGGFDAAAPAPRGAGLGVTALVLAILAVVVASVIAGVAGFGAGIGIGHEMALRPIASDFDLSYLSPVRDSVLWLEISFWIGSALGIWAIIQGIVAIVSRRGRGAGIGAVVIAALGPFVYTFVAYAVLVAGIAAGSSIGG
ncbi:hypothetical protein ASD65_05270 [Microbacterium sp. Root61]|nr:hypothetical protein ASD65_05270 [Microbacterium sp. Root61]